MTSPDRQVPALVTALVLITGEILAALLAFILWRIL